MQPPRVMLFPLPPNQPYSDVITVWFLKIRNLVNLVSVQIVKKSKRIEQKVEKNIVAFSRIFDFFENHAVMDLWSTITAWKNHAVMVLHKSITAWFPKYSENHEKFVKTQRTLCQLSVQHFS